MIIPQYGWFGDKCVGLIYVYIYIYLSYINHSENHY